MSRLIPCLATALSTLLVAAPTLAADYGMNDLRPSFPDEFEGEDPLGFEAGIRYWYALGDGQISLGDTENNYSDKTQFGEAHLRIDDYSTGSYVKGLAGYSMVINGEYDTAFGAGDIVDGQIGYAGGDFGWNPFGATGTGSGAYGFVGYHYWNESPNIDVQNLTGAGASGDGYCADATCTSDGVRTNIDIHALRLGISGKYQFSEQVDISGEVAAVPYAWVNGVLGSSDALPGPDGVLLAASSVDGFGYGAMAEAFLGFHPTDNMALRVGGRAWYLQGQLDAVRISEPSPLVSNPFSLFRYGALAELTFKF